MTLFCSQMPLYLCVGFTSVAQNNLRERIEIGTLSEKPTHACRDKRR